MDMSSCYIKVRDSHFVQQALYVLLYRKCLSLLFPAHIIIVGSATQGIQQFCFFILFGFVCFFHFFLFQLQLFKLSVFSLLLFVNNDAKFTYQFWRFGHALSLSLSLSFNSLLKCTVTDKKKRHPPKFRVFYKYHFHDHEFSNCLVVGIVQN